MNAKQTLHQASLAKWAARFQDQAASGLTVKAWCEQNNVSFHSYNYWKHQLKSEYVDSLLPDIVPISLPASNTNQETASPMSASCNSYNSRDLYHSDDPGFLRIMASDVDISISPSASDDLIFRLIKAVRHA